jgi:hypothetical protein
MTPPRSDKVQNSKSENKSAIRIPQFPSVLDLLPVTLKIKAGTGLRSMTARAESLHIGHRAIALCRFGDMLSTRAVALLALNIDQLWQSGLPQRSRLLKAARVTGEAACIELGTPQRQVV